MARLVTCHGGQTVDYLLGGGASHVSRRPNCRRNTPRVGNVKGIEGGATETSLFCFYLRQHDGPWGEVLGVRVVVQLDLELGVHVKSGLGFLKGGKRQIDDRQTDINREGETEKQRRRDRNRRTRRERQGGGQGERVMPHLSITRGADYHQRFEVIKQAFRARQKPMTAQRTHVTPLPSWLDDHTTPNSTCGAGGRSEHMTTLAGGKHSRGTVGTKGYVCFRNKPGTPKQQGLAPDSTPPTTKTNSNVLSNLIYNTMHTFSFIRPSKNISCTNSRCLASKNLAAT